MVKLVLHQAWRRRARVLGLLLFFSDKLPPLSGSRQVPLAHALRLNAACCPLERAQLLPRCRVHDVRAYWTATVDRNALGVSSSTMSDRSARYIGCYPYTAIEMTLSSVPDVNCNVTDREHGDEQP